MHHVITHYIIEYMSAWNRMVVNWIFPYWSLPLLLLVVVAGRAEPPDACETMAPSHEGTPQPGTPPYEFYLDKETVINRLSAHFAIKARGEDSFAAFMVQARDDATGHPVGEFDTGCVDINVMTCFDGFANTAYHLDSEPKPDAHMRWMPALDFVGNVTFFATVARSKKEFWVRYPARHLRVVQEAA